MMNDLISRQAAMDALARIFDQCEEIEAHLPKGDPDITGYKMYPDYMIVWEYLHQLPSAEPEVLACGSGDLVQEPDSLVQDLVQEPEVVRCKDCKYYNPIGVCIEMSSAVCEDSFCCWAERRTDERSD